MGTENIEDTIQEINTMILETPTGPRRNALTVAHLALLRLQEQIKKQEVVVTTRTISKISVEST